MIATWQGRLFYFLRRLGCEEADSWDLLQQTWLKVLRGIGRLKDRPDLAALTLVLVFGAFANAGGMIAPVRAWQESLTSLMGLRGPLAITTAYYLVALVVAPSLTFGLATAIDQRWGEGGANWWESATRFSYSLVPLGFGMWLSHYSFHLLTSCRAAIPAAQTV